MKGNRSILFVTTTSSFLTPFMGSAINIALPSIGKDLGMDTIMLGWVSTAYLLTAAIFLLPFGRLADRNGRKRLFVWGLVLFGIASGVSAFSTNSPLLILSRLLNGIGGAMIYSTSLAILTTAFPKSERGRVLGLNVASVYLGLSLGPTLGGLITMTLGWQGIFLLNTLMSLILVPVAAAKLPSDQKTALKPRFDLTGSLVYGLSITGIVYGFPLIPSSSGLLFMIAGIAGLFLFIRIEKNSVDPLINLAIFKKNTVFVFSNLAAFINYSATFAVVFLLSLYLQQIGRYSPAMTGLILVSQPAMMTLLSPLAGKLSDRIEPRLVASAGMAVTVAGLFSFTFLSHDSGVFFIVMILMILGMGFALFSSPNTNAVMSSVQPSEYGIASATLGTMRLVGQTMSMGITLLVLALIMGKSANHEPDAPALLSGIKHTFTVFSLLCIAGTWFSLMRGRIAHRDSHPGENNLNSNRR